MTVASKATTSATTKIFISAVLPTTYDATGYGALTWTEIAEVTSLGTFGGKTAVTKHQPVGTGVVVKRAGSIDYGTMTLALAKHTGTDDTAIQAAFNSRASQAFKIEYPTALGGYEYFTGIVTSYQTNIGSVDQILQSNVDIELDTPNIYSAT